MSIELKDNLGIFSHPASQMNTNAGGYTRIFYDTEGEKLCYGGDASPLCSIVHYDGTATEGMVLTYDATNKIFNSDSLSDAGIADKVHTHAAADIVSGTLDDARVSAGNVTQHVGALVHQSLSGSGTNTHSDIDAHISSTLNPHSVSKSEIGLGNVQDTKVKLDGTTAPGTSDDTTQGWSVGSIWVDVTGDAAYLCVDATTAAAQWKNVTQSGSGDFGGDLYQEASDSESSTTSNTFQTKTTLTTSSLPAGTYRLGYSCRASNSKKDKLTEIQVELDGTVVALFTVMGDEADVLSGGFVYQSLSGVVTATIKYRRINNTAKISRARLELWRAA